MNNAVDKGIKGKIYFDDSVERGKLLWIISKNLLAYCMIWDPQIKDKSALSFFTLSPAAF